MYKLSLIKTKNGFTLIELLIVLAISAIIMTGIFSAFESQQDAYMAQKQIVEMRQNLRTALLIITKEIRKAGYDPNQTGGYGILNAGVGTSLDPLSFTYDDGTGTLHTATINLFDSTIDNPSNAVDEIQITAAGQPIAENIAALQCTYLDAAGNVTATNNNIRAIRVSITARPDEKHPALTINKTIVATIKCRNLGL